MFTPITFTLFLFFNQFYSPVVTHSSSEIISQQSQDKSVDSINWKNITDVNLIVAKNLKKKKSKDDKLIFIDFYTDWCGWCKRLDKDTYTNAEIISLMNEHFYAVKFDAEQQESVEFANQSYFFRGSGSRGTNQFASEIATINGRLAYPTIAILNSIGEKIAVEAGYKDPVKMKVMLKYYGEGYYKTMDFNAYQIEYNKMELSD